MILKVTGLEQLRPKQKSSEDEPLELSRGAQRDLASIKRSRASRSYRIVTRCRPTPRGFLLEIRAQGKPAAVHALKVFVETDK